jgi:hypothetical protein
MIPDHAVGTVTEKTNILIAGGELKVLFRFVDTLILTVDLWEGRDWR